MGVCNFWSRKSCGSGLGVEGRAAAELSAGRFFPAGGVAGDGATNEGAALPASGGLGGIGGSTGLGATGVGGTEEIGTFGCWLEMVGG